MASVDIFAVKQQIVAILQADTTNLFDATAPTDDNSKFRKIEAGAPTKKAITQGPFPRMWVTSDTLVATVDTIASVLANVVSGREYDLRMAITFVATEKDGPKGEEIIDDFTKLIIEKLEGNYDLRDDGGAESTRVASWAIVTEIQDLPAAFKDDRVKGRVIKFRVKVHA